MNETFSAAMAVAHTSQRAKPVNPVFILISRQTITFRSDLYFLEHDDKPVIMVISGRKTKMTQLTLKSES
jgi:hypothetical protein